jgi:hypothetical protein
VTIRSACRALLALNVLYCALAAAQEGLPGWHMFESVEPIDYTLVDRSGVAVDVRTYLPKDAWLVDRSELHAIVRFVCEKHPERAPFMFTDRAGGGGGGASATTSSIGPGDCRVDKSTRRGAGAEGHDARR